MSGWKMTAAHFKHLLEDVQDYKCAITGLPLLPENVWILPKIPRSKAINLGPDKVYLVHESIVILAREYTGEEILNLAKTIVNFNRRNP